MAQRKITTGGIANDAITTDLLGDNLELQGNYVKVPVGDTASRPSGEAGVMRFNTDTNSMEQYDGTAWVSIAKPPIISSLSYPGSQTAVSPDGGETITISGTNFATGVNVKFGTTYATSVTRTNSTSLSVVVPALTADTYDVIVENSDGMQATLSGGLESNAAPVFTTAAGSLGNIQNDIAMSTITIVATEDDSGAITYSVTTGALPTGLSISGADIDGTPTGYTAETTVNFTITATDDEGQTSNRAFSLTVLVSFYDYNINQSMRFIASDGHYQYRTPSSAGNRRTWTWSSWVKRGKLGTHQDLFISGSNVSGNLSAQLSWNANNGITVYASLAGISNDYYLVTDASYIDTSSWYHIVCAIDTTQATSSNRIKLYVNGKQVTSFSSETYPSQNYDTSTNNTVSHTIGRFSVQSVNYLDGYLSEINFVDGQQLDATSFGKYKDGIWVPKAYSGTYGTNGFYLTYSNSGNLGTDSSGNGNTWSGNLATHGIVLDTPTNNFPTLNPLLTQSNPSYINRGNLESSSNNTCLAFMPQNTGKWYWETKIQTHNSGTHHIGIVIPIKHIVSNQAPWDTGDALFYPSHGYIQRDGTEGNPNTGVSYTAGDIISVALDLDNRTISFYKNGTAVASNLAINNEITEWLDKGHGVAFATRTNPGCVTFSNFGQDGTFTGYATAQGNTDGNGYGNFYYTPPTGYLAVCSKNTTGDLPFTDIRPNEHFDVVTYSGTTTSQSITSLDFKPDLIWFKSTSHSDSHCWFDSVRGRAHALNSNNTGAQNTAPDASRDLVSFDTNGFTVGVPYYNGVNGSGRSIVAWCWKAGGAAVSNTDGSVTSQVSANTDSGFSIIKYTGTGSNLTIGHGLNEAPDMVIVKGMTTSRDWTVYHHNMNESGDPASNGKTSDSLLNLTNSQNTGATTTWNSTAPTSSTISIGTLANVNESGQNYIAYAWHSVPGYSKAGYYYDSTDGTASTIHCGFKPRWLMVKNITSGTSYSSWLIYDSERASNNDLQYTTSLYANRDYQAGLRGQGSTPSTYLNILFHADGFSLPALDATENCADGYEYIFLAFAEQYGDYSNAN